ncbi:hypothetical protein [Nonomuraea roseoviolacea]|uniref:Uncharacterized protein n=1 Tax=Nonomuraea roseoviolacea subsp. carminata TaxID=160689 RepID=A0ABT1K636_9ACTN|nr:hypothetical protein [Nonomuraea roseoviolacea]MCP2349468.1 hypothetical protein [Nonomuraea roseoviolacea subsp. carminata]
MAKKGKLLPVGAAVVGSGLVLLGAGVLGMTMWPMPGWAGVAFSAGMTLTAPGAFLVVFGLVNRSMGAAMSSMDGALRPAGSGGVFGMIKDLAGGNRDLLLNGSPASAVVLSMRDTGVTVNDLPMAVFELEVRRPGSEPYRVAHREPIPRLLVGAVLPGSPLAVRVDPHDPARLAIDWSQAAGPASRPAAAGQQVSAADILARGVPATVTILGTFTMNGMTSGDGDPVVGFDLRVTGPYRPYEVRLAHRVPRPHLTRLVPGTALPAKIAPEDPQKVAIDWEADSPVGEPQML